MFKRSNDSAAASATGDASDAVQQARTRARRRLIGAVVLLGIGVIGFPLVFETRPRPVPIDIPIEIPRKDNAPPLAMPPARGGASGAAPTPATPRDEAMITESSADAGREVAPRAAASTPVAASRTASRPAAGTVERTASAPAAAERSVATAAPAAASRPAASSEGTAGTTGTGTAAATDGARAKALLDGKPASAAAESPRYVVQVGAFAEQSTANEARTKVEKLGLKTYTQVAETPSGKRIRVRVGPFASRAEADAALAKARAGGLTAVVLTL
jgi:DedD protein